MNTVTFCAITLPARLHIFPAPWLRCSSLQGKPCRVVAPSQKAGKTHTHAGPTAVSRFNGELSCTEAAEALADLLIEIKGQVSDADFDALIFIGSVLYRQGQVALASMLHVKATVRRMRQGKKT